MKALLLILFCFWGPPFCTNSLEKNNETEKVGTSFRRSKRSWPTLSFVNIHSTRNKAITQRGPFRTPLPWNRGTVNHIPHTKQRPGQRTGAARCEMGTRRGINTSQIAATNSKEGTLIMDVINDDLVLVILDFVDVRQVLSTVALSCLRLQSIARSSLACVVEKYFVLTLNLPRRVAVGSHLLFFPT